MFRIYDTNHEYITLLTDDLQDVYTEEELKLGTKTLHFSIPCLDKYLSVLQEENYVRTKDYEYVIKEIELEDDDFFGVYCAPNFEEIDGFVFQIFDVYQQNLQNAYEYCLSQIPTWSVEYHSTDRTMITLREKQVTALDMIRKIQEETSQELWFDTLNKVLHVYDKMGSNNIVSFYSTEMNLRKLTQNSSTYDYATVLYPVGKDGLTISLINNNKPYIENYTYSNKRIEKMYVREDIDVRERLLAAAQNELEKLAIPKASYQIDLAKLDPNTHLGDTVLIVDTTKKIKQQQRVVKITRYPFEPENDKVEIANLQPDFIRDFIDKEKVTNKEIKYIKSVIENISGVGT